MLIAGEASGDLLAAELVSALREQVLAVESQPTMMFNHCGRNLRRSFSAQAGHT